MWRKAAIYGDGETETIEVVEALTCRSRAVSMTRGGDATPCFATAVNRAANPARRSAQVTRSRNHADARSITVTTTITMIMTAAVCA